MDSPLNNPQKRKNTHLVDIAAVRTKQSKCVPPGHESLLNVAQLQSVQLQHEFFLALLLVLVPGNILRRQHEPVQPRTSCK